MDPAQLGGRGSPGAPDSLGPLQTGAAGAWPGERPSPSATPAGAPATPAGSGSGLGDGARWRRWWWLLALATVAGVVAAAGWLGMQPPVWVSTTSVLVHPAGQDTNVVGGRTQGEVNLDTEAQLVRSTALAARAADLLGLATPPEQLASQVSVEVPANTSVLTIAFEAATPADAQAGARAFAEAYLNHRDEAARAELTGQIKAIERRLDELEDALTDVNQRLAVTLEGTAAAINLESERDAVAGQISTMTDRLNELATATVSAGEVISEARLPTAPARPRPPVVLASGAALGLVVGVVGAALAERLSRRIRRPADLTGRLGVPVLAAFTRGTTPQRDEIASPYGPAGRAIDRLRNEVIAAREAVASVPATATGTGEGRVIVVTGPTGGDPICLVAANLAASLARCGHEVILVAAGAPGSAGPLGKLLGLAAAPGLSEVLARRAGIAEALQRPARYQHLRAMTMGGTAAATGLLQSPALRTVLAALTAQAGYVVLEAPGTGGSADAQSLASHADLTLLAVETRRTRLAEVADAVEQLRRVGRPPLGAVLLPAGGGRFTLTRRKRSAGPSGRPAVEPALPGPPGNSGTGAGSGTTAGAGAGPAPRPANGERPVPIPNPVHAQSSAAGPRAPTSPGARTNQDRERLPMETQTLVMGKLVDEPVGSEPAPEGERG